jgi:large subunit ribosomal protein L25
LEQIILNATQRPKKTKKFREEGFIPGVIYGDSVAEADPVKFDEITLKKILNTHGSNVKLWVKLGEDKKFGFIKEIQRHPVTNKIIHLDLQLVSKNHEIKLQIPITFKGEGDLRKRQLQIQIHKSQVEVLGKIDLMPEVITVDVSQKNSGDTVTFKDFNLDKQVKVHDKIDEVYGTITRLANQSLEEDAESEVEE